eukprot:6452042-Amphidinium_carterae.2
MEVQDGHVSWSAADVRSRALAGICETAHWHGEAEVGMMLQAAHDMGASTLWFYKQLTLRVSECVEVVLQEGPERAAEQPLGQGRRKRNRSRVQRSKSK